jgi:hypothetical protein
MCAERPPPNRKHGVAFFLDRSLVRPWCLVLGVGILSDVRDISTSERQLSNQAFQANEAIEAPWMRQDDAIQKNVGLVPHLDPSMFML